MLGLQLWVYRVEQKGSEHAALGDSSVEHRSGGGVTVWSMFVRKLSIWLQSVLLSRVKFCSQFYGVHYDECSAETYKQHPDVCVDSTSGVFLQQPEMWQQILHKDHRDGMRSSQINHFINLGCRVGVSQI